MKKGVNYSAWRIKQEDFPVHGSHEEKIKFLLGYAILAPSTFNSQPWKCKITNTKIDIYLDLNRILLKSDNSGRFAYISMGCFMENFILAAESFSMKYTIQSHYKETKYGYHVATFTFLDQKVTIRKSELFEAIPLRSTNRSLSSNDEIPVNVIEGIKSLTKGTQSIIFFNRSSRDELSEISKNADLAIWSDSDFRKEHVTWVRNNLTKKFDGMPAFGVGISTLASFLAYPIILSPIFPKIQAKKNIAAISSSPLFITVMTKESRKDWTEVGMLFQKINLYLTSKGIAAAPMGQFIENENARSSLGKLTKETNLKPQIFMRLGYPTKSVHHAPRMLVEDVLL